MCSKQISLPDLVDYQSSNGGTLPCEAGNGNGSPEAGAAQGLAGKVNTALVAGSVPVGVGEFEANNSATCAAPGTTIGLQQTSAELRPSPARGRTGRTLAPTLDTFNRGSAAPGLKAVMEAMLGALAHYARLDEAILAVEQPGLLARLQTLPAGADLARILRQEPVRHRTHSRPNVSASLRDMRRRRGRAPTDADYQSGHVVPVLAAAYWGSIADWAERAPARVQHRKGHWRQKAVQIAAVRDVSARVSRPAAHKRVAACRRIPCARGGPHRR